MPSTTEREILNPFAFPSETHGRFRMLIVTALVLAWSVTSYFLYVPNVLVEAVQELEPEAQAVIDAMKRGERISPDDVRTVLESERLRQLFRQVTRQLLRVSLSFLLLMVVVTLAAALYLTNPLYLRRRHHTKALTAEEAPRVVRDLERLAAEAGLRSPPRLEYRPGFLNGLAFGRKGRETLVLYGNPSFLEKTWNSVTQAVALHELGHIVNQDIRNREISRAMWLVLLLLAFVLSGGLLTASILSRAETRAADLLIIGVRSALTFGLIWWIWTGMIRAREFYADWRVATWKMRKPLVTRLRFPQNRSAWWQKLPVIEDLRNWLRSRPWWPSFESWWQKYGLRNHPSNAERIAVLQDPSSLFQVSSSLALLSGFLLTFLVGHMTPLFLDLAMIVMLVMGPVAFMLGPFVLLLYLGIGLAGLSLVTHMVTGTLGVQVQREAAADLASGVHSRWGYLKLCKTAVLFALGLEAGLWLTPMGLPTPSFSFVLWLTGLSLVVWLWLIYLRAMTRMWIGSRTGDRLPELPRKVLAGISTILLAVMATPVIMSRLALDVGMNRTLLSTIKPSELETGEFFVYIFVMTSIMLVVAALVSYVAVSLASHLGTSLWLFRRRSRCPRCGEPVEPKLVIGRQCGRCGNQLASWFYIRDADEGRA